VSEDEIMVKITFLGTGGTPGVPWRAQMGILIEAEGLVYLFDVGGHIERRLIEYRLRASDINGIFITHTHFDHIGGLPSLLTLMISEGYSKKIEIYGPPGIENVVISMVRDLGPRESLKFIQVKPLESNATMIVKPFKITSFEVKHTVEAYGYEIDVENVKVVYTGDTKPHENVKKHSKNAKLVIHEASFPDWMEEAAEITCHSTIGQAIYESQDAEMIALVHITKYSQEQIVKGPLPPKVIVPSDLTVIKI